MKTISVDVLSDPTNDWVVQLPHRKYPGIVVQGDSLASLVQTGRRVAVAVARGSNREALDEISALRETLEGWQDAYELALRDAGVSLPYSKTKLRNKVTAFAGRRARPARANDTSFCSHFRFSKLAGVSGSIFAQSLLYKEDTRR